MSQITEQGKPFTRRYFVLTQEAGDSFWATYLKIEGLALKKMEELFQAYNPTGFKYRNVGEHLHLDGVVASSLPCGKSIKALPIDDEYLLTLGYKRIKEGRAFAEKLKQFNAYLTENSVDFSTLFFKTYPVKNYVRFIDDGITKIAKPIVFMAKDKVVVDLPAAIGDGENFPQIPTCFIELKKSEFITLTEE